MGFFQSLKDDLSTAVNELIATEDEDMILPEDDSVSDNTVASTEDEIADELLEEVVAEDVLEDVIEDSPVEEIETAEETEDIDETIDSVQESETASDEVQETTEKYSVRDALNSLKNASRRYEQQKREERGEIESFASAEEPIIPDESEDSKSAEDVLEAVKDDAIFDSLMESYREKMDIHEADTKEEAVQEPADETANEEIVSESEPASEEEPKIEAVIESDVVAVTETEAESQLDVEPEPDEKEILIDEPEKEDITVKEINKMADEEMLEKEVSDETAVITEGMTIKGNVESNGNMELSGAVNGNINILGKLDVSGKIHGDTQAGEVFADGAEINGLVSAQGSVKVGQSTVIIGNVSAKSAVIAGAVKGDIDVHGPVILDSTAIIMGNIKSASVQINNGAVIEGLCSQCYAAVSPSSFFEEFKKSAKKL